MSEAEAPIDVDLRLSVLKLGPWLGWAGVGAACAELVFGGSAHRVALVVLLLAATALNGAAMRVPWRRVIRLARGRLLLDLWSGALVAFVALLVVFGGVDFSLLLFVTVPYIAIVHAGSRRILWLAASGATCILVAAIVGVPAGITAMRSLVLAAVVAAALLLAAALEREAAARRTAVVRAELERTLAAEANHRIKNDLQTAVDLLLLDRPAGGDARAFDDAAARLHALAALHRLLAERGETTVDSEALLSSIARSAPVPVAVEVDRLAFDPSTAQKVGLVANELITNASRHGAAPISVSLGGRRQLVLRVDDAGHGASHPGGVGLRLVQHIVQHGLGGDFRLTERPGGGTRAEVVFPNGSR